MSVNRVIWSPDGALFGKLKYYQLCVINQARIDSGGVTLSFVPFSFSNRGCILKAHCANIFLSWG